MLVLTLLAMGVAYLDRVCISTAAPAIRRDLGLDDAQMGIVFSAFTLAYALFEVPAGWLADRFGARAMLARIVVWWSAMTAATGAATGFASLVALRFLFGAGEAGVLPSMARAYARWLPFSERGRAFGLTIMAGALSGAATQPLVVWMLERVSWRMAFPIFGAVGLVWAAVWLFWFRDDPRDHRGVNAAELERIQSDPPAPHPRVPWRAFVRSPRLLSLCAMYFGAIYGWYFYLTWLPTYLLRARGFDLHAVGWLAALPLLAIATGSLAGGAVSDLAARRFGMRTGLRLPGLVGLPLAAAAIVAAVASEDPRASAYFLAAAAGLGALGVAPAWAVCLAIGGRHAGVVSGAMNTFGNLGGMLSPVVVGASLASIGSWDLPLYTLAGGYLFSALCWLGVDPERPLEIAEREGS
ncbi:putative sulfoacetate transporter SauU [Myxococcaceae bacterium]|jgi:sugar phosphate permease|nr:putative sulfoacetate transporter SauU [Myxococcaceae bacterium]